MVKPALKAVTRGIAAIAVFPLALISGFGRLRSLFSLFSQFCALFPGIPGDYLRCAYYRLTMTSCSWKCRISFGTIFSTPDVRIDDGVYIGAYCVIGRAQIGEHTQIASHVQILSGARQHARDEHGNILGAEQGTFRQVVIGPNAWIGAGAIVMADVGARTTIGAGAIVTKSIPSEVTAVGNPAKVLKS